MIKVVKTALLGLFACVLLTGCATVGGLQIMYGNQFAPHTWQGNQKQTTLPFALLNQHTIVTASVDGVRDLRMVLDTGASATVLFETDKTRPLLSKLGHKFTVGGIGKGDRTEAYFLHNADLTLGSVTIAGLSTVFFKAADNPMFPVPEVTYIDGVIGYDLFSRFTTEINFDQQTVRLSEQKAYPAKGYQRLPLRIENNLPYIDITLRGQRDAVDLPVMFDTGGVGALLIASEQALPAGEPLFRAQASGLGGGAETSVYQYAGVTVGQYAVPDVIGAVYRDAPGAKSIMGTSLINRFNLIVDYAAAQLYLSPNQRFEKADFANRFGAILLPHTNGAYINSLRPDSVAQALGLKTGDVIVTVNGEQISHQNFDASDEALAKLEQVAQICYLRDAVTHCESVSEASPVSIPQ